MTMISTIMARAGGRVVNLFVFLVLAHSLSLEDLGLFGFAYTSALLLVSGFDVGIRNSVAYFIGRQPADASTFALQALKTWLVLVIPCTVALGIVVRFGSPTLAAPGYLAACSVLVAATLFVRMMQGVLIGQGRMGKYNETELASRVVLLVLVLALLVTDLISVGTALWALAGAAVAAAIVLLARVGSTVKLGRWRDTATARALLRRGVQFMVAVLLMTLGKRISFLTLSQMGASIDAGRFYGVMRLTEVLTEIALAVAVVVFSGSVRAASDHDAISEAARSTRVAFSLFLIVSVVGGLSASWLLPLALGGDFVSEAALFRIILAGTLCGSVWAILFPSLSAVAPPSLAIRIFAPGVALGLALSVGLYHAAGVVGVSWAYLATNALLSVAILLTLRSRFAIPVHAFLVLRRNDAIDIVEGVASCFSDRVRKRVRLGHS